MRNKISIMFLFLLLTLISSSAQKLDNQSNSFEVIPTGSGPEDMVLDTLNPFPRLLISATSRRPEMQEYGEIEELNLMTKQIRVLPRRNEPSDLEFHPHGICLVQIGSKSYLYAITHYRASNQHPVIRYRVYENELIFERIYEDCKLVSPNALTVFENGSFLVCNDASSHGNKLDQILGLKRGNIVFFDLDGQSQILTDKLGMPAGMNRIGDRIYVSCATGNRIYSFDFKNKHLINKRLVAKIKGPDNISIDKDGIWVACHLKTMAFIKHIKDSKNMSPTTIYNIETDSNKSHKVFMNNGKWISAGSVAVSYSGSLYIGQIFDPFIIKTERLINDIY